MFFFQFVSVGVVCSGVGGGKSVCFETSSLAMRHQLCLVIFRYFIIFQQRGYKEWDLF